MLADLTTRNSGLRRPINSAVQDMENPFYDRPILNSPYEYPYRHWELDETGQPTQQVIESRRGAEFITPIPKPRQRGRARGGRQAAAGLRRGAGSFHGRAAVRRHCRRKRNSPVCRPVANHPRSPQLGRYAGDGPAAPALAAPQVQPLPSLLLPGRSRGDADLAHRGCPAARAGGEAGTPASGKRQPGGEPGTVAGRAEAGHRCGQDHGDGHDHRCGRPSTPSGIPTAGGSRGASWWSRPELPSGTGCGCCSRTIPTATTPAGSWCQRICWATCSGPG